MSAGSDDFVEFVKDQLASVRGVSTSRFFGGIALASEGTQFAMIMGGTLYFVVDDRTRPHYEKMGSSCFSYETKKGRVAVEKYYAVPAEVLEDHEQLLLLARESIRVANSLKGSRTSSST